MSECLPAASLRLLLPLVSVADRSSTLSLLLCGVRSSVLRPSSLITIKEYCVPSGEGRLDQ